MEEELIFKFLDSHVGDGIVCKKLRTRTYGTMYKTWNNGAYAVLSDNGTMILWFQCRDDMLKIYSATKLTNTLESLFSLPPNTSWKYVRTWIADKHNLIKVNDLLKFIPK